MDNRKMQQDHVQIANGPMLHEPFLIGDKVRVKDLDCDGMITGIALQHVVCTYIVTVAPEHGIEHKGYETKATSFCISASQLELIESS